jgi:hypothetical protein
MEDAQNAVDMMTRNNPDGPRRPTLSQSTSSG